MIYILKSTDVLYIVAHVAQVILSFTMTSHRPVTFLHKSLLRTTTHTRTQTSVASQQQCCEPPAVALDWSLQFGLLASSRRKTLAESVTLSHHSPGKFSTHSIAIITWVQTFLCLFVCVRWCTSRSRPLICVGDDPVLPPNPPPVLLPTLPSVIGCQGDASLSSLKGTIGWFRGNQREPSKGSF